jgi:pilus assembly protein TadC
MSHPATTLMLLTALWVPWMLAGLALARDGLLGRRRDGRRWGLIDLPATIAGRVGVRLDPARTRQLSLASWAAFAGIVLLPPAGVVLAVPAFIAPELARRRRQRDAETAVVLDLPEAIDLFRVGATAGLSVTESARLLAHRGDGPIAAAFAEAVRRIDRGARVGDALEEVVAAGEVLRPLVRLLTAVERYGLALEPAIGEVAVLARADRRRRVETAARQVAVRLLHPLVCCILPAFVVLTIVPSLVATFSRIHT